MLRKVLIFEVKKGRDTRPFYVQSTMVFIHLPFFTKYAPTQHFRMLSPWQIPYTGRIPREVKLVRINAAGTLTAHIKPESNMIVIIASPPERRVKYVAWVKASRGITRAHICISRVAMCRTSGGML